jgi:hypothetical protein
MLSPSTPRRFFLVLTALLLWASSGIAVAQGTVPSPALEGPITNGAGIHLLGTTTFDLADAGYVQDEYFMSGVARAYTSVGPLSSDGTWTVSPGESAPYKTRFVVYRPKKKQAFNGTVIVEWLNVSGGVDAGADWIMMHTELIREGYAWVGLSAQIVGIEGGVPLLPGLPILPAKVVDPARYGSLSHPGDSFSYDMFSQAGRAIREPMGPSPLGNLKVERVLGVGESQSAFRLTTYINAIHPIARVYDGFLVHSRGGGTAPLAEPPQESPLAPNPAFIRTDIDTPVMTFQTETDLTLLGFIPDRQPDSAYFRLWEVAGTAHADTYTTVVGRADLGKDPRAADLVITTRALDAAGVPGFESIECPKPINSGPQHFVLKAAIAALDRWVRTSKAPEPAPRIETTMNPIAIARDEYGNARGGVRTPQLDVPIAAYSGGGQAGSVFCILFGSMEPFDAATLAALYPTHRAYVSAFKKATRRAVHAGFIRKKDARLMTKAAAASSIGR